MSVIDFHCDTIFKIMREPEECLRKNKFSVDVSKLKKGNYLAQFFAMFIYMGSKKDPKEMCLNMIDRFYDEVEKNSDNLKVATNYDELVSNSHDDKISAFLTIEEGGALKGDIRNLELYYDKGVRLITLTWNFENEIGFPGCEPKYKYNGLTKFGKEVVDVMNDLGMIVDVSHLNDKGFYDVAEISRKPFVASHSNAREVCNCSRNLTDDMIRILSNKGGVMGINFCGDFLGKDGKSSVNNMVKHIKHIRNVGGIDVISLGTDFDGIGGELEISNSGEMDKLAFALKKEGFTDYEIEKIFYKNAERVIQYSMK